MKKINKQTVLAAIAITAIVAGGIIVLTRNSPDDSSATSPSKTTQVAATSPETPEEKTKNQLLFLIEEEKLAHDVYTVMFQKYGASIFGNILESESTHQGKVLSLLQARNIPDPRSSEIGVFTNSDLQSFYNTLITQGNQSITEAYKAGVIIEERDIADINVQLATTSDDDVISTLEALRKGSESHLRAFNRQL
jgi:hypothetical protein